MRGIGPTEGWRCPLAGCKSPRPISPRFTYQHGLGKDEWIASILATVGWTRTGNLVRINVIGEDGRLGTGVGNLYVDGAVDGGLD